MARFSILARLLAIGLIAWVATPAWAAAGETASVLGAHGLRLPATFSGVLPCADCAGIRFHLNLWPDQAFALRRTWLGKDVGRDDIGRWSIAPERRALILWDVGDRPLHFAIQNNQRLRQLDQQGQPIVTDLPIELNGQDALEPLEVRLPLGGMFVYFADAARLTECRTGRSYPVAMEGDYRRLEQAYLEARRTPGQPLLTTFEGSIAERPRLDGQGTEATVVVERLIHVWPGEICEHHRADASLTNTYWRIVRLGEAPIDATDGHREPHLLLRLGEPRFSATVGCNQLAGSYETIGDTLRFGPTAATRMACPPPLDRQEQDLLAVLAGSRTWRLVGQTLQVRDEAGATLALFQAVYLR